MILIRAESIMKILIFWGKAAENLSSIEIEHLVSSG